MKRLFRDSWSRVATASAALTAVITLLTPCTAQATAIKLMQHGSNVIAIGSGEFELNGLTPQGGYLTFAGIHPTNGYLGIGLNSSFSTPFDGYSGVRGPSDFGNGDQTPFTSGTGSAVSIDGASEDLFVPSGYVSGTALSSSASSHNASFTSPGVTPGKYTWTWGSAVDQSFTLDAFTTVPEPAALGMLGFGLLLVDGFLALHPRQPGST